MGAKRKQMTRLPDIETTALFFALSLDTAASVDISVGRPDHLAGDATW